jgi:hypothetical protein
MMNTRTKIISVFFITMLAVLAAGIGLAKPRQFYKITGDSYTLMEDWGNTEIWTTVFAKADPSTEAPKGKFAIRITNPYVEGERYYETTPVCMNFYQDDSGISWAIVVHRITEDGVSGFGPGLPGEYAKWKIQDTGEPGGRGDSFSLAYECYDENFEITCDIDGDGNPDDYYDEFWPAGGEPPACDDAGFVDLIPVEDGNLVIH